MGARAPQALGPMDPWTHRHTGSGTMGPSACWRSLRGKGPYIEHATHIRTEAIHSAEIQEGHGPRSTLEFSRVPWLSWVPGAPGSIGPVGPQVNPKATVEGKPFLEIGPGGPGQGTLAILAPWGPRAPLGPCSRVGDLLQRSCGHAPTALEEASSTFQEDPLN